MILGCVVLLVQLFRGGVGVCPRTTPVLQGLFVVRVPRRMCYIDSHGLDAYVVADLLIFVSRNLIYVDFTLRFACVCFACARFACARFACVRFACVRFACAVFHQMMGFE